MLGKDVSAIPPTRYVKSLCYASLDKSLRTPKLSISIVVTPLTTIMKYQDGT